MSRSTIVTAFALGQLAMRINQAHEDGEQACWRGLEHFRAAGQWLLAAKAKCGHGKWLKWLEKNVRFSQQTASRYMRISQEWDKLLTVSNLTDALRLLTQDANGDPDEAAPHVANNSGVSEWYTPPAYLDAARATLGSIDLDPASSPVAQRFVKAKKFLTINEDGLASEWRGKVWLNPPYAAGLVEKFVAKLCGHLESGDVSAAVLLTNNATETKWFQGAIGRASALCFKEGRIKFLDEEGEEANTPLQGQVFVYFGGEPQRFCGAFKEFGACLEI
jgi:ParB family chromosome partitioning protein